MTDKCMKDLDRTSIFFLHVRFSMILRTAQFDREQYITIQAPHWDRNHLHGKNFVWITEIAMCEILRRRTLDNAVSSRVVTTRSSKFEISQSSSTRCKKVPRCPWAEYLIPIWRDVWWMVNYFLVGIVSIHDDPKRSWCPGILCFSGLNSGVMGAMTLLGNIGGAVLGLFFTVGSNT